MDERDEEQDQQFELTHIQQMMINAHEMFVTATHSGFSRQEALYVVTAMLCGGPRMPTEE